MLVHRAGGVLTCTAVLQVTAQYVPGMTKDQPTLTSSTLSYNKVPSPVPNAPGSPPAVKPITVVYSPTPHGSSSPSPKRATPSPVPTPAATRTATPSATQTQTPTATVSARSGALVSHVASTGITEHVTSNGITASSAAQSSPKPVTLATESRTSPSTSPSSPAAESANRSPSPGPPTTPSSGLASGGNIGLTTVQQTQVQVKCPRHTGFMTHHLHYGLPCAMLFLAKSNLWHGTSLAWPQKSRASPGGISSVSGPNLRGMCRRAPVQM